MLLEDDHAATGDALCALHEFAGSYRTDAALCSTHRSLLRALRAFEIDMHQHVHEENNVLFPARAPGSPPDRRHLHSLCSESRDDRNVSR